MLKLASVTTSTIVLSESDDHNGVSVSRVDRLTGDYYFAQENLRAGPLGFWSQRGNCTPQPFTGFGGDKAKF